MSNVTSITGVTESGDSSTHTLQAFTELVYVQTANDVMVTQMASLENSLGITQNAMNLLTQVQNLHNDVTVPTPGSFAPNVQYDTGRETQYEAQASAHFNAPIGLVPDFSKVSGGSAGFLKQLLSVRAQISAMLPGLSAVTPLLSNGSVDSNSLLANMRVVLNDIKSAGILSTNPLATQKAGVVAWLEDTTNTTNSSVGIIQQHITNAITAGQSLNTTQTESVRNYLYLYEEYYKSASAVLTAISQIIQKMADGISR